MKTIKNEVVGLFVITALMPVLIPTYLAYHLLFKEQDFVKKEQKTKKKSNIVEDKKRNYYDKWMTFFNIEFSNFYDIIL